MEIQVSTLPLMQIGRRIVVEDHRHVNRVVDIVEDPGHRGRPAGDEQVLGVGSPRRPQPSPGCPCRPGTEPIATVSVQGSNSASTAGSHHGLGLIATRLAQRAEGPMESLEGIGTHLVAAIDDGG